MTTSNFNLILKVLSYFIGCLLPQFQFGVEFFFRLLTKKKESSQFFLTWLIGAYTFVCAEFLLHSWIAIGHDHLTHCCVMFAIGWTMHNLFEEIHELRMKDVDALFRFLLAMKKGYWSYGRSPPKSKLEIDWGGL